MISYELAKQLKELWFPQNCERTYVTTLVGDIAEIGRHDSRKFSDGTLAYKNMVAKPSLSELIEACGNRFSYLNHYPNGELSEELRWSAGCDGISADGETAEIAVAHLWLVLNKK